MANIKIERLNHTYQQEISKILMLEIKDQDINFVTITDVDVTNDLSFAKVYFTVYDKEKIKETTSALNGAASFIRGCLADKVNVRHTPELKFIYDESIDYGNHIDAILEKINNENEK